LILRFDSDYFLKLLTARVVEDWTFMSVGKKQSFQECCLKIKFGFIKGDCNGNGWAIGRIPVIRDNYM
jgi:hypothetical protein